MKDQGINKKIVQDFDTSARHTKGVFYGFRKMFWTYLKKLNVPFYDPCCAESSESDRVPVAFDLSQGQLVKYNTDTGAWDAVTSFTTTTTSTTTTTTAAPTTTTTTTIP